jgi:hypothetical protein
MSKPVTVHWSRLKDSEKETVRKFYEAQAVISLIQYLKSRKVISSGGCNCNITPTRVMVATKIAIENGTI